jgi:hypothetical protein
MVESQIGNLTQGSSFGHNLWFKYPNGSWEPILDIYIPKWYKYLFKSMNFDPYNCPINIWEFIHNPIPKVGVHLGVWGFILSHFPTLSKAW